LEGSFLKSNSENWKMDFFVKKFFGGGIHPLNEAKSEKLANKKIKKT
jgi:hypothetical protein